MDADFSERLMEILNTEKQTWWAEKTDTSQSMVSNYWWKGKDVRSDKLLKILKLKNVSANWLFFNIGPKNLAYLDDAAIAEKQEASRKTQIEIMNLTQDKLRLADELKRCQITLKQTELLSGLKNFIEDQGDGSINSTILSSLSLLKMVLDIIIKMAESYSKENIDEGSYLKIVEWIEQNLESQKFSTASTLKGLDKLIR